MKAVFVVLASVAAANASFEEANECSDVYNRDYAATEGRDLCTVTETFAQCLGRATADLPAAQARLFDNLLQMSQEKIASLNCEAENLESPTIDIVDGSMEVKVARRDADIKFYRYGRSADVSIFDLDQKVAEMAAKVDAAAEATNNDTKAAVDAAVKTVGDMNAAFATSIAESLASTVSGVKGDITQLASKQDSVNDAMAALKTEINTATNDKIKLNSESLTNSLTSTLTNLVNTKTEAATAESQAAASKSDAAAAAALKAFEQACASGGLKYDASAKKCAGGADATSGDGKTFKTAAKSCKAIKAADTNSKDGMYWIQATAAAAPVETYCIQTVAGGGWTLVASVNEGDVKCRGCSDDKWSNTNGRGGMNDGNNYPAKRGGSKVWESTSTFGEAAAAAMDDFKSSLYSGMPNVQNMMVMNVPNGEHPDQWYKKAYVVQYSDSNWMKSFGNLQGYFKQYPPRYGCPRQGTNNIRVKYAKGSDGTLDGMISPHARGQTTQGYWSFSRCNWENSMFPFCQNKATGRDNEHFCIGASYVHGHGTCAQNDFNAWDWHCGVTNYNSGWSAPSKGMFQTFMFFYKE